MWLIKLIKLYTAIGAFIRTLVLPGMSFWDRKNFFKPAIRGAVEGCSVYVHVNVSRHAALLHMLK